MNHAPDHEKGHVLLTAMISAGLALAVVGAVQKRSRESVQFAKRNMNNVEVAAIRKAVKEQMSCEKTLNLTGTETRPLKCSDYASSRELKRLDGSPFHDPMTGRIGKFSLSGACRGDKMVIAARSDGKDPLTGQLLSSLPIAEDIFSGTESFCSEFFLAPGTSDPQVETGQLECIAATRWLGYSREFRYLDPATSSHFQRFDGVIGGQRAYGWLCADDYERVSCFSSSNNMRLDGDPRDMDIRYMVNGCWVDESERIIQTKLSIICCKTKDVN